MKHTIIALLVIQASLAAHTTVGMASGLSAGLMHPISGLDHIIAMVAVGFLAAKMGKKALWLLPVSFVSMMSVGALIAMQGIAIPYVETGIMTSSAVLFLLIVFNINIALPFTAALTGLFGVFHGHAHGAEMPLSMNGMEYAVGFLAVTLFLHLFGIVASNTVYRHRNADRYSKENQYV